MDEVKTFLKEYNNELLQSPTSDENVHPKIVSNYCLGREDVSNQVIDWVLHYLENRKCPYQLAVAIAKSTAKQMDADISEQLLENSVDQEKLLNSYALYTQTLKKLQSTCKSFLEQNDHETCSSSYSLPYTTSVFDIKNKRRTMEDRHVVHRDLNFLLDLKDIPAHSYYAVFDGHSGVDAASYASAHLHVNIAKHPDFLTDTPTAIAQSFKVTDEDFLKKCSQENLKSGSTAVCALLREKTLYLSWVGDSQAVLVKGGKPVLVTDPHRPDRPDERERIEVLGGTVTHSGVWRVNGMLAITRALGDLDYRPFINSEPEITVIDLDGTEDFLILACDGLWDGMSPEGVAAALYQNLSESAVDEPLEAVAAKLVHKAKEQGSEDNITAIVVFLRDIKTIKDYATELLSPVCSQTNFLVMNGEEKHGVENPPCVKPTVLELNAASTKKLKNTANVLSSTGVSCSVYSESGLDVTAFQNSDDNSIFVPHQNLASCFAPEATALSELPTPPIDDVVASQKFGNLCSEELLEGLNSISSEQPALVEDETNAFNSGVFDSMVNVQPLCPENQMPPSDLHIQNSVINNFTPDEAADIASTVVSNTIETAVKCLSSSELYESVSPVSTIKLNPYAKPFIPGETQLQNESEVTTKSESIPAFIHFSKETEVTECQVSKISFSEDCSMTSSFNVKNEDSFIEEKSEAGLTSNDVLEIVQKNKNESPIISVLTSEFSELSLKSPQLPSRTESEEFYKLPEHDHLLDKVEDIEILGAQTNSLDAQDEVKEQECLNVSQSPEFPTDAEICAVENTINDFTNVMEEVKNSERNVDGVSILEGVPNIVKSDVDVTHDDGTTCAIVANEADIIVHGDQIFKPVKADSILSQQIENHPIELTGECLTPKEELLTDKLLSSDCISEIVHEPESCKDVSKTSGSIESYNACIITPDSEKSQTDAHVMIQSTGFASEFLEGSALEEKYVLPAKVSDTGISLESVTFGSLNIVSMNEESSSTEAVLPSDLADEGPVEAFAVDLQAVPVGVPEAEGVTEDIDSDSEKDGGWSYMKVNNIGSSGKPKPEEPKPEVEKSASKLEAPTKLKKDVTKAIPDNKSKVKSLTSTDKVKKPLLEKRAIEIKDKSKPTRTVSSTLPRDVSKPTLPKSNVEKATKPTSTFARIKKEVSTTLSDNKVSSIGSSKPLRPTSLRNPAPSAKPGVTLSKELKIQTAATKTTNSTTVGNIRPKSALNTNGTKAPLRTPAMAKVQPPNQSKTNLAPSARSTTLNRPIGATVPTRALNKPSTLSKPTVPESKAKPLASTIRKIEPKKPDIKETKDIVNKQISARKNLTVNTIIRSEVTKSATTSNKRTMTLSNKPVPSKTRSAPMKSDANKKDVPKSAISRLAPKANNPLKSSNAAKSDDKKVISVQDDKTENPSELAAVGEQSSVKITPASGEEKFMLEVNDKEVIQSVKEKDEIADQKLSSLENGIAENVKPLEETVPAASGVECSAQNL